MYDLDSVYAISADIPTPVDVELLNKFKPLSARVPAISADIPTPIDVESINKFKPLDVYVTAITNKLHDECKIIQAELSTFLPFQAMSAMSTINFRKKPSDLILKLDNIQICLDHLRNLAGISTLDYTSSVEVVAQTNQSAEFIHAQYCARQLLQKDDIESDDQYAATVGDCKK